MTVSESANPPGETTNPPPAAGRNRLFRTIMVSGLVMFMAFGALGAELAARYSERHRQTPPDYFPSIYYPHRRLRYGLVPNTDYYGWFKINSFGFRGREVSARKPPGVFRIVCLGGSTTFDIGSIGTARPWPEVMESELRRQLGTESIEVLNLGIGGATSLDHLIDLQMRAIGFEPDLVIVYQGHNDLIYSIPPPYRENSPLFPLEDRPRSTFNRWLTYNSLLYAKSEERVFSRIYGVLGLLKSVVTLGRSVPEPGEDRGAAMELGLANFRSNVRSIAAISRANRIRLALVEATVPFPESGAADKCQQCDALSAAYGGMTVEGLQSMFGRYNEVLGQVAAEGGGVDYIPTKGFVPSADRFYHDPVHFGPEGSVQLGTKLSEALAPIVKQIQGGQ